MGGSEASLFPVLLAPFTRDGVLGLWVPLTSVSILIKVTWKASIKKILWEMINMVHVGISRLSS